MMLRRKLWRAVVLLVGGVYCRRGLSLVIHDRGWFFARDMIVKREWVLR